MNNHYRDPALSPNTIDLLIDSFIKMLEDRGDDKKSLKDAQSHFANWYNKEYDKNNKTHGNSKGQPNIQSDREAQKDYSGSF
jgi:hypothetical protein